jgi:chromosome segregation ATPase
MQDMIAWISGVLGAVGAVTFTWLRNVRARRAIGRLLSGSIELDEQTSRAVSVSLAALQASLDRSLKEHEELASEVSELRVEVARLRARDAESTARVAALQAEVVELREENCRLRKRLEGMRS